MSENIQDIKNRKGINDFITPMLDKTREYARRSHVDNVQDIWRRHGWVPPTEARKDFRASLKTTAHLVASQYY